MDRKGIVRIPSTNITENIIKILLREGFIENVRKKFYNIKVIISDILLTNQYDLFYRNK